MIGHHNERSRIRQVLASSNLDAFGQPQDAPHPPPPQIPRDQADQAAFAVDGFQSVALVKSEIMRRLTS